jgi:predicted  nucleic acid-binding Zn-ribbon protein
MSALTTEKIIPTPKKLADLRREYRELDNEVENEIRVLRERRHPAVSKFEELLARLALMLGSSQKP